VHVRCAGEGPELAHDLGRLICIALLAHHLLLSLSLPESAQREGRRVVPQGDALERAERFPALSARPAAVIEESIV
jgi:hypothetical protein